LTRCDGLRLVLIMRLFIHAGNMGPEAFVAQPLRRVRGFR